ncbi:DUF4160 domain-containing protein [Collimonas rhizosphaerae]|uniref:DUF4160 domain-containing protein n=1 Tax=Collimonas rhizosphaerae TaxID=3126357 RepID=UPI003CCC66F5
MPTVLAILGLRVTIYPNDHRPAHVHVIGCGCEAVFNLHCPDGPAELRENYAFSPERVEQDCERAQYLPGCSLRQVESDHGHYR